MNAMGSALPFLFMIFLLLQKLSIILGGVNPPNGNNNGEGGLKILIVMPSHYRSHFSFHKRLGQMLIKQTWVQKVHLFIPEEDPLLRDSTLSTKGKLFVEYFSLTDNNLNLNPIELHEWDPRVDEEPGRYMRGAESSVFLELYKQTEIVRRLRDEHFDVGITEVFFYGSLHFLWLCQVKHMVTTSALPITSTFHEYLGHLDAIVKSGDVPELWSTKVDDHSKFRLFGLKKPFKKLHMQSLRNTCEHYKQMDQAFAEICKQHYTDLFQQEPPSFKELFLSSRFFFVNTQPQLEFPDVAKAVAAQLTKVQSASAHHSPLSQMPTVVFVGGITVPTISTYNESNLLVSTTLQHSLLNTDELAEEEITALKDAAAARQGKKCGGLILVSFGTLAKIENMPDGKFYGFLAASKAMSRYEFLWKMNKHDRTEIVSESHAKRMSAIGEARNVHTCSYIHQVQLLANPLTRLFISHCGMNSVLEAVLHGVPLLCVPLFADQFYNAEALASRGLTVVLDKQLVGNSHVVRAKIEKALHPRYKAKMVAISKELLAQKSPADDFLTKIEQLQELVKHD